MMKQLGAGGADTVVIYDQSACSRQNDRLVSLRTR